RAGLDRRGRSAGPDRTDWRRAGTGRLGRQRTGLLASARVAPRGAPPVSGRYAVRLDRRQAIAAPQASAIAGFHGAFHLTLAFAVLDRRALVVRRLALGQRDVAFHLAVLPVQVERHHGIALLLHLADQAADL